MYLELEACPSCPRGVQAAENQDMGIQTFKSQEEDTSMGDEVLGSRDKKCVLGGGRSWEHRAYSGVLPPVHTPPLTWAKADF